MLFDKNQDGLLTFPELRSAMRTLGQRHEGEIGLKICIDEQLRNDIFVSESDLLKMVRSVSEDKMHDTIEFNEFLKMMSKQEEQEINMETLLEAFKYYSSISGF